ncbi:MAG: peptide chain release factor N(5)-glutamine methyltransferase [Chitinophagaceae bacterium]|nr:peptide chain release factor N(5)-glutamine methyltransferase [Chitinophagaceae bacterium]
MLNIGEAFYQLKAKLIVLYDEREAAAIAHEVLEHITGMGKTDRLVRKDKLFSDDQEQFFYTAIQELVAGKPLQYVTNSAWFLGNKYYVDPAVLIPRPETEELVLWVVEYALRTADKGESLKILEIGTGSGCIPISLKEKLPRASITSCDVSAAALQVARKNADLIGVNVDFVQLDFLNKTTWNNLASYDIIVSNPPYIPLSERERLHINVREYEPATALFVPHDDALVFYDAIATFAKAHLRSGGSMFFEIDNGHAIETRDLFMDHGFKTVELRRDMFGNDRMLFVAGN